MTALEFNITSTGGPRVRTIKFTPERMDQIRNLVERGKTRHEIADMIGVTVGSLQVTCSKAGISLRQPPPRLPATTNGRALVPVPAPAPEPTATNAAVAPPPVSPAQGEVRILLRLVVGNRVKDTPLPISMDVFAALCCTAEIRGMTLGELFADLIMQVGT